MDDKQIIIYIWIYNVGWVPAGVIIFSTEKGYSGFTYFTDYIDAGYPSLNPATLNYKDNPENFFILPSSNKQLLDRTFLELLPQNGDFGTEVLIKKIKNYEFLSGAEKLHLLNKRVVGGLKSLVREDIDEKSVNNISWLEDVRKESVAFHLKEIQKIHNYRSIQALTSYGGYRPKAMFEDDNGDFWIAKFNVPTDPYNMAKAEHAAMMMCHDSGLLVPDNKVITLESGEDVFLTKRFDRDKNNRFHSLALFSLIPGMNNYNDYDNVCGTIYQLLKHFSDFKDADTLFLLRKMLIDVALNNTDNHLRNLRIILNKDGKWELSPIFDVIFNPLNEQHIYNPTGLPLHRSFLNNQEIISSLSEQLEMDYTDVEREVLRVKKVALNWKKYCAKARMSTKDMEMIQMAVGIGITGPKLLNTLHQQHKKQLETPIDFNFINNMKKNNL